MLKPEVVAAAAETRALPAAAEHHISRIATGYIASAALHAALILDIPDRLDSGPRAIADLARETGTHEDTLCRLLRALASLGLFKESSPRTFASTPLSTTLRRTDGSFRDATLWMTAPLNLRVFARMTDAVHTGRSVVPALVGESFFELLANDPSLARLFDDAMISSGARVVRSLLATYDFHDIAVLVDVGGGRGQLIAAVLRHYPRLGGILVDLEHVVAGSRDCLEDDTIGGRCRVESGSFFDRVPRGGNAYILKRIVHDWDDDRAVAILANVRAALDGVRDGRLLLVEVVVDGMPNAGYSALMDLGMLLINGGRERTRQEFATLLDRAGFELTGVVPLDSGFAVIEARVR